MSEQENVGKLSLAAIEDNIDSLTDQIASIDERFFKINAIEKRYKTLIEIAPENGSAKAELVGLQADIARLLQAREKLVLEREALRLLRDQLSGLINPPASSAGHHNLPNIFDTLNKRSEEARRRIEAGQVESKSDNPKLAPVRHAQSDFFVCDLVDYALKDDQASMEAPIFSLSTREDMQVWKWTSEDGKKYVEVAPSGYGRATQHDKDILIYCTSQLTEALNRGTPIQQTIRFTAYDLLVSTNRNTRGDDYERLRNALDRLSGTRIKTEIKTGGQKITSGFGIIDKWRVVEKSPDNSRMVAVEVTLSDWLFNAIQAHEVLTIHPNYFRLRKPLERRLYEIARKHVGKQGVWKIGLEVLRNKCGSERVIRNFRLELKGIISADTIPDYRYSISDNDMVTVYSKNQKDLANKL